MFKVQMREGSHPYQVWSRRVTYALQGPLKEKLDRMQKQQIVVLLDVDETFEWCNSFMLVPKANGKVRLCLDLAGINKALGRLIHRGLTPNDILPRVAAIKYLMLIDVSSRYHNVKLDEQSSYLTLALFLLVGTCIYNNHLQWHWLGICFREK